MNFRLAGTALDSRFRGNDDVSQSSIGAPSSFPRKRESSGLLVLAMLTVMWTTPSYAQEWTSLEKTTAPELFGEKCGMCHRATGMGTGILARRMSPELALLENREDLQPEFVATVVRNGFGVMFPISRAEVSDAQLQMLVDYLTQKERAQ